MSNTFLPGHLVWYKNVGDWGHSKGIKVLFLASVPKLWIKDSCNQKTCCTFFFWLCCSVTCCHLFNTDQIK